MRKTLFVLVVLVVLTLTLPLYAEDPPSSEPRPPLPPPPTIAHIEIQRPLVEKLKTPEEDEETPWEKKVKALLTKINAMAKLRDFDRRNLIGRYSGLIYRVADGKTLDQPIGRATRLVDIVPVYETQLEIERWQNDPNAEDFGQPLMWKLRTRAPGTPNDMAQPEKWVSVHPSRVQIIAEGSVGQDFLDGVPLLRAGYNNLVDLEKIGGGSAEGFLKNSARSVVFEYAPEASVAAIEATDGNSGKTVRQIHEEQTAALNRNIDSSIVIQGGKANTLQTQMPDPAPSFEVAANLFAASVQIPFTILFGQQTGRLASDQDRRDFAGRCKSRQDNLLTPMFVEFITRMQDIGVIDQGEFEVEWPPVDAPTDEQRVDILGKMTAAMQQAAGAGITQPLFDANELRGVVHFEERDEDGMPEEGDGLDDPGQQGAPGAKQPAQQQGGRQPLRAAA